MKIRTLVMAGSVLLAPTVPPEPACAKVVSVEVERREEVLGGRSFGNVGPYEKLGGRILFAFDPENPSNARIVDLEHAPRNGKGLVEAWADFMVLRPKDPSRGSGVAFVEVGNRGRKISLRYFNHAEGSADPTEPEHFGDALFLRMGLTVIWVGWQYDVPLRDELLRLHVPRATEAPSPLEGLVRADWTVEETVRTLDLAHRSHVPYPVLDPHHPDNVLTVRDGRLEPRRVVPRTEWRFAREEGGRVVPDSTRIHSPAGFRAGKIYELVYRAKDPAVVGLGLAAIRDVMAYAKHDPESLFPARRGIAWGVSQTGRFLRHFVYQGFNTDEEGRKVYDGLVIHTAGAGRGSFNHRFGQPSRDAHRYSAFFYPTDIFPFTGRIQRDPITGKRDGLFAHAHDPDHLPRIVYTNAGYEYWGRAAGLIHTSLDGSADVALQPNERLYHLAGGQHYVAGFPPSEGARLPDARAWVGNPMDFFPTIRALLVRMVEWVTGEGEPPPSRHPRIDRGTLVPLDELGFPEIPGVEAPRVAHEAYRADYGLRWEEGIVDRQPPVLGPAFPVRVPGVDGDGNELGGIRGVQLRVPVATYAPWSLRTGRPGPTWELNDFVGTYAPFPRTEAERRELGDPRPSLEARYGSRESFLARVREAAGELVEEGVLLREDVERVVRAAAGEWDWVMAR